MFLLTDVLKGVILELDSFAILIIFFSLSIDEIYEKSLVFSLSSVAVWPETLLGGQLSQNSSDDIWHMVSTFYREHWMTPFETNIDSFYNSQTFYSLIVKVKF